jgi:hypothetical protein
MNIIYTINLAGQARPRARIGSGFFCRYCSDFLGSGRNSMMDAKTNPLMTATAKR